MPTRLAVLLLLLLAGCVLHGDGARVEIERRVPRFHAIEAFGAFEVHVVVDPELGASKTLPLRVSGDRNALDRLFTEVHGEGVLSIAVDPNLRTELELVPVVTLEVPALTRVHAREAAQVSIVGARGELEIETWAESAVRATELSEISAVVRARAQSEVTLAGAGPSLVVEVGEVAVVQAERLAADAVQVRVSDEGAAAVCSVGEAPEISGAAGQVEVVCAAE